MIISQIPSLTGPTPSICVGHHQCLCGQLQDSEVAPEMNFAGPRLANCSSPDLLQGLTCSSPPPPKIPGSGQLPSPLHAEDSDQVPRYPALPDWAFPVWAISPSWLS